MPYLSQEFYASSLYKFIIEGIDAHLKSLKKSRATLLRQVREIPPPPVQRRYTSGRRKGQIIMGVGSRNVFTFIKSRAAHTNYMNRLNAYAYAQLKKHKIKPPGGYAQRYLNWKKYITVVKKLPAPYTKAGAGYATTVTLTIPNIQRDLDMLHIPMPSGLIEFTQKFNSQKASANVPLPLSALRKLEIMDEIEAIYKGLKASILKRMEEVKDIERVKADKAAAQARQIKALVTELEKRKAPAADIVPVKAQYNQAVRAVKMADQAANELDKAGKPSIVENKAAVGTAAAAALLLL